MSAIQPVILSGGAGTRLWPASRAMYPKQLLPLTGKETMLQQTAMRLSGRGNDIEETIVICNETHRFLVAEQLRQIDHPARIVLEPEGRNTAPAVALAAILAMEGKGGGEEPLLLVMPADHVIRDAVAFAAAVGLGESAARAGQLVTFGIVPTGPNTGYGYIEAISDGRGVSAIESFVEKPDLATARKLLQTGRHYWNSGIFLFRADIYLDELRTFAPEIVEACTKSVQACVTDSGFIRPDGDAFRASPADSIDYAVMENTRAAAMVPLDAGWSDVGSWAALHDVSDQDDDGNAVAGDVLMHDCSSSYLSGSSRLLAAVGLDNIVVVEDKDSVLVARKDRSQDVKLLVDMLKKRGREESRVHREVFRPWGSYDCLGSGEKFQVKQVVISAGGKLSIPRNPQRNEYWVVVSGTATVSFGDEVVEKVAGDCLHICADAAYCIDNRTDAPLRFIEVQCGDTSGAGDAEQLGDY